MSVDQAIRQSLEETTRRANALEAVLVEANKGARAALSAAGVWQQEFHGTEALAIIAMYVATKSMLDKKEDALTIAIDFIGKFEESTQFGDEARKTLELINQALVGESIERSIQRET